MNEIKIFATGRNGDFILYSGDEGSTWTSLTGVPDLQGSNSFVSSSRYSGGRFIFVGDDATTSAGQAWISSDYGTTFTQSIINDPFSSSLYEAASVQTLDGKIVFISCNEGLHWSVDAGVTFDRVIAYDDIPVLTGQVIDRNRIYFQDQSNGLLAVTVVDISYFFKTSNGGQTWVELTDISPSSANPDYLVGQCYYKDETNIIFTTDKYIFRSSDNGVNFSFQSFATANSSGLGTQLGITPNGVLFTTDGNGVVYKNTNPGPSGFNPVLGSSGLPTNQALGISFYTENDGFITMGNGIIYKTIDAGLTWSGSYTAGEYTARSIIAVSYDCGCPEGFIPDEEDPSYCIQEDSLKPLYADYLACPYKLTRCYTGEISYTTEAESPGIDIYVNKIVKPDTGKTCAFVEEHDTFEENYVILSGISEYSNCLTCQPLYYIYDCQDQTSPLFCTSSDLSGSLGAYVKISVDDVTFDGCYRVGLVDEFNELCEVDPVIEILEEFGSCEECDPPVYKLTSCANSDVYIYTTLNLSEYLNKSITLQEYPKLCWTAILATDEPSEILTVTLDEVYSDCTCCFQYQCN
jgi:photosystem II stability/assembly factor-like uncharacterized protein